jgi:hypothetical protein
MTPVIDYPKDGSEVLKTFIAFGTAPSAVKAVNGRLENQYTKEIICGRVLRGPNYPTWIIVFEGLTVGQKYRLTVTDHTGKYYQTVNDLLVQDDPQQITIQYPPSNSTLPGKSFASYGYTNDNLAITGKMRKNPSGPDTNGTTEISPPGTVYWVVSFDNLAASPPTYTLIIENSATSAQAVNLTVP